MKIFSAGSALADDALRKASQNAYFASRLWEKNIKTHIAGAKCIFVGMEDKNKLYCLSMSWIIVGLGNPGEEYEGTRHNTGRMALDFFARQMKFGEWKEDKKAKAHVVGGMIGKIAVVLVAPDTFMNKSGAAVAKFVKSQKAAERMVVVYDELDLPLGALKLSFNRGSGGHKGIESIMQAVKTKKFTRVRIGISPETAGGKLKKPSGEKEVVDHILKAFRSAELETLKPVFKKTAQALEAIVTDGPERAMNRFN